MYESIGPSWVSLIRQPEPSIGYPSRSPDYWHFNTTTPIVSYRAPPQFEGMRNPQMQTSQLPVTTANAAGPSTAPPTVLGYSRCTLHPGGNQPESQEIPIPRFGPPLCTGGVTAPQSYGPTTSTFLGRPSGTKDIQHQYHLEFLILQGSFHPL